MDTTKLDEVLQKIFGSGSNEITIKKLFEEKIRNVNMSRNQVEKLLNIERKTLNSILDNTAKRIDIFNIIKICVFLDINLDNYMKLFLASTNTETQKELEIIRKSNFINQFFDIDNLKRARFIKTNEVQHIEKRIKNFFGFDSLFEYLDNKCFPAFSRTKNRSNNLMRDFWVNSAYIQFTEIANSNEYKRELLLEIIPKIRPYTMNIEKGLLSVARALFNIGITVIYQPYLPTVQVRGATLIVNNKPCIVLTDYNKSYPTIWFALIHELHHVLYDLEDIERRVYHLTGELDIFLTNEDLANDFARDFLFSKEKSKYIEPFIDNEYVINEYARECQIHPSFIYNFYMYDKNELGNKFVWGKYNKYFPDIKSAIKSFNLNPFEKESLKEVAKELKKSVFNL